MSAAALSLELPPELVEAIAQRAAALVLADLRVNGGLDGDPWLDTAQAGQHIGSTARRVRDLVEAGALPHSRDGRKLLIRRSTLDAYVAGNDDDRAAGAAVAKTSSRAGRWSRA